MIVQLTANGYKKTYPDGSSKSFLGTHENDEEVQEFIANGGVVDPEFTQEDLAQTEQDKINATARNYLDKTDWYVIRHQETGEPVPPEILTLRTEARAKVVSTQ